MKLKKDEFIRKICECKDNNQKLEAVKCIMLFSGLGLRDSKDIIDTEWNIKQESINNLGYNIYKVIMNKAIKTLSEQFGSYIITEKNNEKYLNLIIEVDKDIISTEIDDLLSNIEQRIIKHKEK